jgi:hypothetical protein
MKTLRSDPFGLQEHSSRRQFLKQLSGLALIAHESTPDELVRTLLSEKEICEEKFRLAARLSLRRLPIGEVMIEMGKSFLGTPYVARTLEAPGAERLIVRLSGLDCVTLVENSLALSRCIKLGETTVEGFKKQLQFIRYRSGVIDEYPSRLHYFSDWIDDNEEKGVVRDITNEIGGIPYVKRIDFMSAHAAAYEQLGNAAFLERIRRAESALSARDHYYVQKKQVPSLSGRIHHGDILAITTSVEGLDISHTGLAIRVRGVLRFLHAPLAKGAVQITRMSLADFLELRTKNTGIMVARPQEPI